MAIPEAYKTNFTVMQQAFANGDVVLADALSGKPVYTVCICTEEGDEVSLIPIAKMFDGNPFEELVQPGVKSEPST